MKSILPIVYDHERRGVLERHLRERFGAHCEVEAHANADEALARHRRHARAGRPVAAVFTAPTRPSAGARSSELG